MKITRGESTVTFEAGATGSLISTIAHGLPGRPTAVKIQVERAAENSVFGSRVTESDKTNVKVQLNRTGTFAVKTTVTILWRAIGPAAVGEGTAPQNSTLKASVVAHTPRHGKNNSNLKLISRVVGRLFKVGKGKANTELLVKVTGRKAKRGINPTAFKFTPQVIGRKAKRGLTPTVLKLNIQTTGRKFKGLNGVAKLPLITTFSVIGELKEPALLQSFHLEGEIEYEQHDTRRHGYN